MDERLEQLINEYLDGALDELEQTEVERVLAQSEEARAYYLELQSLFGEMEALPELPLPRDLSPQIMAQVGNEGRADWSTGWLLLQLVATVGLLVVAWPLLSSLSAQLSTTFVRPTFSFADSVASWQLFLMELTAVSPPSLQLDLPMTQLMGVGLAAFVMWLVGNFVLLDNGRFNHFESE